MSSKTDLIHTTISFLLVITSTTAQKSPSNTACCGPSTLDIRFPFGIQTNQPQQLKNDQYLNCTYPGFNLTCQSNSTTLHLPNAGTFTIHSINYLYQQVYITDPNNCFPMRMSTFNLTSSPFHAVSELRNFVLFSCPAPDQVVRSRFKKVKCMSNDSSTVIGLREGNEESVPESCVEMERVLVPSGWVDYGFDGFSDGGGGGVWLGWDWPDCRSCEAVNGLCGFRAGRDGLEVGCSDVLTNDGLSMTINYALGFGIPCILCILAIIYCTYCKKNFDTPHHHHHHHQSALEFSAAVVPQPLAVQGDRGFNRKEDGTCPICLCEYRGIKALKTLPECNHYFHAACIDAWLKLNSTCPVCRADTPDRSSSSSAHSRRLMS